MEVGNHLSPLNVLTIETKTAFLTQVSYKNVNTTIAILTLCSEMIFTFTHISVITKKIMQKSL